MLMDDMKYVIELPLKGQISIQTDNDVKYINQRDVDLFQI